jgi:hypothetical protein
LPPPMQVRLNSWDRGRRGDCQCRGRHATLYCAVVLDALALLALSAVGDERLAGRELGPVVEVQ